MSAFKRTCIAFYILLGISSVCYFLMRLSRDFADFFGATVGAASRRVFTWISDFVPFSMAEALVLLIPVFVVIVAVWIVKRVRRYGGAGCRRVIAALLAVFSFFVTSFVFNGASGYFGTPMDERLGLEGELTREELVMASEYLASSVRENSKSVRLTYEDGATALPYSLGETARLIVDGYDSYLERTGLSTPQSFVSVPKILVTSPLVTYTHISGIYCDYTGEININVNYPDFVTVSTVAHEMAHQRGVSPENEANFIAYAVLSESVDPYLRYAGALDAWNTVSSYLRRADGEKYKELYKTLGDTATGELYAYSKFFDKYRESRAAEVASSVNDAYLKSQGTSGTVSYDESTYLIVKYILKYQTEMN